MGDNDFSARFPDMQPLTSAPSLQTINGIGTSIYGSRDYDEETGTYVKTQCFCVLFLPVIALGAYRVADAPSGGWYFIGKVPLSRFAKAWNVFILLSVVCCGGLIAWESHTSSPDYIAGKKLDDADGRAASGQLAAAAQLYREVALGNTRHAGTAVQRLNGLLDGPVSEASATDAAEVFKVAAEMRERAPARVLERGVDLSAKHGDKDPRGAIAILNAVAPLAKDPKDINATRQKLLERLVTEDADNPEWAIQLAVVYESQNELPRCEKLLTPHAKRLGTTEGARILGHIYASAGNFEDAYALLNPYAQERLQKFQVAQQTYEQGIKSAQERIINQLKQGHGPGFDYNGYKHAPRDKQDAMVDDYLNNALKNDGSLTPLREAVVREANVVPVALDLGIATLHRAQTLKDPDARKAELEKAEKTFLAVRGVAGESIQYRFNLGQVYYWLGKHAEGKKLFDDLLASQKRSYEVLMGIGRIMREVGAYSDARALTEEAYNKEKDPAKKHAAADLRGHMQIDLDDEIKWLSLSDTGQTGVKASLCFARGNKSLSEGKDDEASKQLREAIALHAKETDTAASLNNTALCYLSLYRITGARGDLDKAAELLDKAVALDPRNSILLSNAVASILSTAMRDIAGNAIDFRALKANGHIGYLAYLYKDQAGRNLMRRRVRTHPGVVKARAFLDRLIVLAPKNGEHYSELLTLHGFTHDATAVEALGKRLAGVDLDFGETARQAQDFFAGKDMEKFRTEAKAHSARAESTFKALAARKDVTFAIAAAQLASARLSEQNMGLEADLNEAVRLSEQAHQVSPSRATHTGLTSALFARATRDLARKDGAFGALIARSRHSLNGTYLIAVALATEGAARSVALGNADVQRALQLTTESVRNFPDEPNERIWAMIRLSEPKEAQKIADAWLKDPLELAQRNVGAKIHPYDASNALRIYWSFQMSGEEAKGKDALKEFAARKVPLPIQ